MYEQVITPNLDPVIRVNGKPLLDWLGWCMGYVHAAFNSNTRPSAYQGWLSSTYKHADRNFPKGAYFPAWFNYYGTVNGVYGNWGHVVICYVNPNGSMTIWSSPLSHKPYADKFSSIEEVEAKYKSQFIGWSEDVVGTVVIKPVIQSVPKGGSEVANRDQVNNLYKGVLLRDGDDGGLRNYTGRDANQIVSEMLGSDERRELEQRIKAYESFYNTYVNQIADLSSRPTKDQLAQLGDALKAEQAKVVEAEAKLKEEQAKPPKEVTVYTHDKATADNVSTILKVVNSIKGLVLNLFKKKG